MKSSTEFTALYVAFTNKYSSIFLCSDGSHVCVVFIYLALYIENKSCYVRGRLTLALSVVSHCFDNFVHLLILYMVFLSCILMNY